MAPFQMVFEVLEKPLPAQLTGLTSKDGAFISVNLKFPLFLTHVDIQTSHYVYNPPSPPQSTLR